MSTEHGPERCHRIQCDAPPCRPDRRAYERHVRRLKAYGRWQPYVSAEPARSHVAYLRAFGMGIARISKLSGVSTKALAALIYGVNGKPPTARVRIETMERLRSVRPELDLLLPSTRVDATGTRRRIQSLQTVGWSQRKIAALLDSTPANVGKIVRGENPRVSAATAIQVRDLYDKLWNTPPPARTVQERRSIAVARRTAAANGWVPPLAWDDDTIDNPAAEPAGMENGGSPLRRLPDDDELLWLTTWGETPEAIAARFTAEPKTVRDRLSRARREVAA